MKQKYQKGPLQVPPGSEGVEPLVISLGRRAARIASLPRQRAPCPSAPSAFLNKCGPRHPRANWSRSGGLRPTSQYSGEPRNARFCAHRVDSLRGEDSDAIGAKGTCRERRKRVDLTNMTQLGQ